MQIITVGKKRYDFPDEVSRDEIEAIIDRDNKGSPTDLEPTDYASVALDLARPTQSKMESLGIGAAKGVAPSAAFLTGMGAGATAFAPFAAVPVVGPAIPLAAGIVGGFSAAWGAKVLQEAALDRLLSDETKKYIAEKEAENPGYTRLGGVIASGFKPSFNIEKTALELLKNRGAPAALGGAITAGTEVWANRNEPGLVREGAGERIMEAAAEMALLNQTTRAGKAVEKFGGRLVPDKLVRGMEKIAGTPPRPPAGTPPPVVTDVAATAAETDLAETNRRISEMLKRNDAMYEAQLREEGRAEGGSSITPDPKSPRNRQEPPPISPDELPINREFDKQDVINREERVAELAEEARIKAVQELQRVQELEYRQKKEDEALNSGEPPPSNVIAGPDTPIENLIGTRVTYGEITGILIRDAEGKLMVMPEVRNKSDAFWHEVEGGGNAVGDPDIRAADLRIVPLEPARATVKRPPEVPPIPEVPAVIPRGPLPVSPVLASSPPPRNSFITPVELMPNTGSFLYRGGSSPAEGFTSPYLSASAELPSGGRVPSQALPPNLQSFVSRPPGFTSPYLSASAELPSGGRVPSPVADVSPLTEANLKLQKFIAPEIAAQKLPPKVPVEKPSVDSGLVQDVAEKKAYLDELLATKEITPELHAEEVSLNDRRLTNPITEVAPPVAPAPVVKPLPQVVAETPMAPAPAAVAAAPAPATMAAPSPLAPVAPVTRTARATTVDLETYDSLLDIEKTRGDTRDYQDKNPQDKKLRFNRLRKYAAEWLDRRDEERYTKDEKGLERAVEMSLDEREESYLYKGAEKVGVEPEQFYSDYLTWKSWQTLGVPAPAAPTPISPVAANKATAKTSGAEAYSKDSLKSAFNLTDKQATATDILVKSMGLDESQILVAKGGKAGRGSLKQVEGILSGKENPTSAGSGMSSGEGTVLSQGTKGAYELTSDGKALIRGFESADVSTASHEIAHVARRQLLDRSLKPEQRAGITNEDIAYAETWSGAKKGVWNKSAEEKFARGFEKYLRDGQAPTKGLQSVFSKFANWLSGIYQTLVGSAIDIKVSPKMKMVFDQMVTRSERLKATAVKPMAKGTPALEGANKLPSVASTSQDIEVRLSASTSEIPGISKLAAEVSSGDRIASQLLSSIARDSIKYLFKDIKSAKITYQPSTGRYGQSLEASLGLGITFEGRELPTVLTALSRFAKNFKQQEIHVLGEAKGSVGDTYSDGSFNTLVYTWKIPKLSPAEVADIAKNSGFKGFTLAKGKLETYFVENSQNENQIRQFRNAEENLSKLFGPASAEIRRLWTYGDGKIPLPTVPDSVPAPSKIRNATAQRIATRLASRKVKPVAQAKELTPEQEQFQTEIAREYGKLKDDNLADPSVRRAYQELTAELIEQFDSIPAVIEFYPTGKNPYPNSAAMREDVLGNNHLYIYKTEPTSFGPPGVVYKNHPLLEPSGRVDANREKMLNNDILRAAHDYYAHTLSPVQFGVLGEEAAARNHAAMTRSPWARWALMTETRGQNSYVNMGPNAVRNRNNPSDVIYAPQKTDLLPIRFAKTGDPVLDAEMDAIASKSSQPVAAKPRGSFPSAKDRGAINVDMLSSLGQTLGGGTAGFAYGYNKDPDASKEDKVINGVQWALFGAALGTKALRSATLKGITTAKIPLGLLPESMRNSAFGGANNFVIFTKGILGELQTAIKSQSAETAALAYKATQSLEAMERMRGKVSNADWNAAMAHLGNRGSPSLIADRKLQSLAKVIRAEINDFGLDMIGRGYVQSGSDLEATILFNNGKYLTLVYELFKNPDFKPDPKLRDKVISEYVDQARAEGSTKPTSDLETEGLAMAIDIVTKREGSALAPKGANLAMGNGYARTDGSMFKPRKNLSDAISKYMGRIDDPLVAASYTVDRMAHFLGASITQSKMAEVGLDLGLFSRTPDKVKYTVKLSSVSSEYSPKPEGSTGNYTDKNKQSKTWVVRNGEVVDTISGVSLQSSTADVGPLAPLYTTPEVSDALRTLSAYGKNGPLVRILASTTGLMKVANTGLNPESFPPNVTGSIVAVLSQGSAAKVLLNPTKVGTAFKVSFSDILPVKSETLSNDVQFLIREQVLRHGVNAQDVVDTFKNSVFSNMGRSSNSILLAKGVRKLGSGMLNAYQKMEEIPRLIGFYAEVNKYSDALYNRLPEQLTTAERLAVYKKAATIVRENYPNYAEVPEVLRLASLSGGLPPFVSWQYEAFVRNPYNTVLRAKAEMAEGFKTGNKKLTAMGVNRLSWFIGTMVGSVALATAMNKKQGLSDDQEKAARYFMPPWDKNSPLVFPEVTNEEIAYANQSYLNPQAVLGQAIDDAIKGKTPIEATYNFLKSLGNNFISDGGLLIKPMSEAISGTDSYGNKVYTENAGGLFDVSKLSGGTRDAAIAAQQFVERYVIHGFKNIVPRAIKVADKYIKASNDEVGPNGQVYKIDDLNSRMMGLRINRMSLKATTENKAASLSGEMYEATTAYSRARNARNVTPESLDVAYNLYEQQRYAVWLKMQEYLRNGSVLGRSQQELLDNLSGVDTGTKIGLITDVYTPANKEKTLSARDRLEALQSLPEGQRDAEWASLLNTDPREARKILSLIREENREDLRGLTGPDKMLQKLDHDERAMKIAILISKIPDQTEKEMEWDRLSSTGLLRGRTGAILTDQDSGPLVWAEARATLERNLKRGAR